MKQLILKIFCLAIFHFYVEWVLYVKLRLYSISWRMCLYVKHFIISGNKKAVTLL